MNINSIFGIEKDGEKYLIEKRINLLLLIDKFGSIAKASKELPISYKGAWDMLNTINNLSEKPLFESKVGGTGGGGAKLTSYGKEMIDKYFEIKAVYEKFLNQINNSLDNNDLLNFKRIGMQISARNQISGKVTDLKIGAVNGEVFVKTKSGNNIIATITKDSIENLSLDIGKDVVAIFKANAVLISKDLNINISARNKLKGKIQRVISGTVTSEIVVELGHETVVSNITLEGEKELDLKVGDKVLLIIKASNIIIGV
jgi:molybdate transport system regulatory protein